AGIFPCFSAVDRFEYSDAVGGITADRCLSRTGVNHIVIGWCDGDRADRRNGLLVEKWSPVRAGVGRFPHATRNRAKIISIRFTGHAFDRERPPTAKRPDLSPLHSLEQFFI